MPTNKNILVLYTELAHYTLKCFSELASVYHVNIHILRMPVSHTAPFEFKDLNTRIHLYDSSSFDLNSLRQLYETLQPELIYCAGWTNELYLKFCKLKKEECKTLLGFDTKWEGTFRQYLGSIYSKIKIVPNFSYAFVPGKSQAKLALRMGFKKAQIIEGAYSADVDFFKTIYQTKTYDQKILIFVGRYVKEKGIDQLCECFIELSDNKSITGWQLWCVGKGEYPIPSHGLIKDFGFLQPSDVKNLMKEASVFVLPSIYEPWALVAHEFASAGFPMLCSDEVGSNELFLRDGLNGFVFKSGNRTELIKSLQKMCNLNPESLKKMGELSYELAHTMTPRIWADSFYKLLS